MIRVAFAEDHAEMRTALRLVLQRSKDIEVVCEACDGREALDCVNRLHPDVLVMDIWMPVLDGLASTKMIRDMSVDTRVLLISLNLGEYITMKAREAGAHGFLPKDNIAELLVPAIEAIHRGETFFLA